MPSERGFPPAARLLKPGQFDRVRAKGRSVDLGPLIFRIAAVDPAAGNPARAVERSTPARLGLAISRKVGNAVIRNRIKRRVREAFRHRQLSLKGVDLVVTGRPAAADLESADLQRLFDDFLRRAGRA